LPFVGDALAVLVLALVAATGWLVWRRPFVGLGVLVAGMAFHNFLLMVLLRLGTSAVLVRAFQAWKEIILVLLVVVAGMRVVKAYREGRLGRPIFLDWVAAAFLLIMLVYFALPSELLHSSASLQQRLAAFRLAALMPVLYALGRTLEGEERDLSLSAWLMVGAGAVVGAFGLFELWLVPTRAWLDLGINQFSSWLGFQYAGPKGLPENFFQTIKGDVLIRRMVSTYLSPLGIAYTGLLVFPISVVLIDRQRRGSLGHIVGAFAIGLLLAGVLFSVTRLALFALVGEVALLALLIRRPLEYGLAAGVVAAVVVVVVLYPQFGPVVDRNLNPTTRPTGTTLVDPGDPSFVEHLRTVLADVTVFARHPLGEGLGSTGTSANRFASGATASPDYAPGESAILTVFVDTGVLGGVTYLLMYLLALFQSMRGFYAMPRGSIESALPLAVLTGGLALLPITLTSDVWGDLSVTFLFWWAAGYSATLAVRRAARGAVVVSRTARVVS
jgi:hypothetical protein